MPIRLYRFWIDPVEMDVYIDWFNRVYKRPPNELEAELSKPAPDEGRIAELAHEMVEHLAMHEALLARRDHLLGDELFHCILHERQPIDAYPRLRAWIERADERPRV